MLGGIQAFDCLDLEVKVAARSKSYSDLDFGSIKKIFLYDMKTIFG